MNNFTKIQNFFTDFLQDIEKKIVIVCGPTASGKSNLALEIAKEILNNSAVIINADSMQVYKEIPIITAQPSKQDRELIEHKLYGYVSLMQTERYSVGDWLKNVVNEIKKAKSKCKTPIIVGGTGMYIHSLMNGLIEMAIDDFAKEKEVSRIIDLEGLEVGYKLLTKKDPDCAFKISPNDKKRIMRALTVIESTGEKFSVLQSKQQKPVYDRQEFFSIYLRPNRESLYKHINVRAETLMSEEVFEEIKLLRSKMDMKNKTLPPAIGLRELVAYLDDEISLENAKRQIQQRTRNYAKRQYTWFNGYRGDVDLIISDF